MKKTIIEDSNPLMLFGKDNIAIAIVDGTREAIYDKKRGIFLSPAYFNARALQVSDNLLLVDQTTNRGTIVKLKSGERIANNVLFIDVSERHNALYYDSVRGYYSILSLETDHKVEFNDVDLINKDYDLYRVQNVEGYGLYCGTKEIIPVDSVKEITNDLIVTNKSGTKYRYIPSDNFKTEEFDDIKIDGSYEFYSKNGIIHCFSNGKFKFWQKCEDLEPIGKDQYIIKENGKKSILKQGDAPFDLHYVAPGYYDEIKKASHINGDSICYLYKDGKMGMYYDVPGNKLHLIDAEFDQINHLQDRLYYFVNTEKKESFILDISRFEVIEKNIDSVKVEHGHIIAEKNSKKVLICGNSKFDGLDSAKFLYENHGHNYFEVQANESKILLRDGQMLFIASASQKLTKDAEFFEGSPVFAYYDDKDCTHIYSLECGEPFMELLTLTQKYRVFYLGINEGGNHIFEINGEIFEYVNQSLREVSNYYALYEFKNASVFSVTNNREVHNSFIKDMDSIPENRAEKVLIKMNKNLKK